MNVVRVGRVVRTLRRNRGWRQTDLARRAACSQQVVSLIECGLANRVALRTLDRVIQGLDAELDLSIRWHGGQLERLLDEGHAILVGRAAERLVALGWSVRLEVTYEIGRATGSIDLIGWQPDHEAILIGEVKTEILAAETTLRRHDEKTRLAPAIAAERFGWAPRSVSRLLILPRGTTAWRALGRRADLFERAYPVRGHDLSRWFREPDHAISAVWSVSDTQPAGGRTEITSRRRVRIAGPTRH